MKDWTDLHHAAHEGDVRAVKVLLAEGADPNAFQEFGFTPLHFAADHEQFEIVRLLLDAGSNINAHDESCIGNTPLGEVAGRCSFAMAEILVSAGADPTISGWMQLTALDRAEERDDDEGRRVYHLLQAAVKRDASA